MEETVTARPLSSGAPLKRSPKLSDLSIENVDEARTEAVTPVNDNVEGAPDENTQGNDLTQQILPNSGEPEPSTEQFAPPSQFADDAVVNNALASGEHIVHETPKENPSIATLDKVVSKIVSEIKNIPDTSSIQSSLARLPERPEVSESVIQEDSVMEEDSITRILKHFDSPGDSTARGSETGTTTAAGNAMTLVTASSLISSKPPTDAKPVASVNPKKKESRPRKKTAGGDAKSGTSYSSSASYEETVTSYQAAVPKQKQKGQGRPNQKKPAQPYPNQYQDFQNQDPNFQNQNMQQQQQQSPEQATAAITKGIGAISFKVPGRITHKTTIKIAHYPQAGNEIISVEQPPPPEECYVDPMINDYPLEDEYGQPIDPGGCDNSGSGGAQGRYSNNCNFCTYNIAEAGRSPNSYPNQTQMMHQPYYCDPYGGGYNPYGYGYSPY